MRSDEDKRCMAVGVAKLSRKELGKIVLSQADTIESLQEQVNELVEGQDHRVGIAGFSAPCGADACLLALGFPAEFFCDDVEECREQIERLAIATPDEPTIESLQEQVSELREAVREALRDKVEPISG